jgi:hypothetical protein
MHTEQNIWTSLSYRFFRAFEFCYTLLLDTVPGMTRMIIAVFCCGSTRRHAWRCTPARRCSGYSRADSEVTLPVIFGDSKLEIL